MAAIRSALLSLVLVSGAAALAQTKTNTGFLEVTGKLSVKQSSEKLEDECGLTNPMHLTPNAETAALHLASFPGAGIDKFTPFQKVLKSGFRKTTCIKDYMYYHGDKFGKGKHSYKVGNVAPVSIVHYDAWVAKEDREQMTPEVCFKFCRTVPNMGFFGIVNGGKCYCEPYFKAMAGSSEDCYTPCAGDASQMCGGKSKSTVFSMHMCPEPQYKFINTLADAPEVDAALTAKVFYMEAGIKAGSTNTARIGYFHSGIGIRFSDGTNYTMDWWAREGLKNALLPGIVDGKIAWNSKAVIEFQERIKDEYWTKQNSVGTMTGAEWNSFRSWLVSYANDKTLMYYQLFAVASPDGKQSFVDDVVCDSFTQAGLSKLKALGMKMESAAHKRNYVTLHSAAAPTKVDMSKPAEVKEMADFYGGLFAMAGLGKGADTAALMGDMVAGLKKVAATGEKTVFIGSPGIGMYKVVLSKPFVTTSYSSMPIA